MKARAKAQGRSSLPSVDLRLLGGGFSSFDTKLSRMVKKE